MARQFKVGFCRFRASVACHGEFLSGTSSVGADFPIRFRSSSTVFRISGDGPSPRREAL
jgi:hypothetical protein